MHAHPSDIPPILASAARLAFGQMLPWIIALIVLVIAGGAVVLYIRHRFFGVEDETVSPGGLTEQLRAMRDRGELTEEEYEQARLVVVARATGKDLAALRGEAIRKAGGRVAEPGFDLLGRPLPGPGGPPGGPKHPPIQGPGPENPIS
jgi:hypothetical protein